jgi:hypothetical protein
MSITLDRYDNDAWRIMRDGEIIGFALALSNGRWGAFDAHDRPLCGLKFASPRQVRDWIAGRPRNADVVE